jgi:hypothetical protein
MLTVSIVVFLKLHVPTAPAEPGIVTFCTGLKSKHHPSSNANSESGAKFNYPNFFLLKHI